MNFAESVKNSCVQPSGRKLTENGAIAYSTTDNALLDFFATSGALRPRSEANICTQFSHAFHCDPLLATKMLFHTGNVRGGLGERRTFRVCLRWLANARPAVVRKNLSLIPLFNRWDSLFVLIDTPVESDMWAFVTKQLTEDMQNLKAGKSISLLAKWLPSQNTHSAKTRELAYKTMHALGLTPRSYRKILSALRKRIRIVERDMSANNWQEIDYPAVPSYAMKNYSAAFKRHDQDGFVSYLNSVKRGEKKINASTLYPYDLVHQVWRRPNETAELQWKALPNYVQGDNNILVMADVSGSMYGRPIETSIGLATYFAQRNKGAYHNLYMTFTDKPQFITLRDGMRLYDIVRKVCNTGVGYSTNLEAAFMKILTHAVSNNIASSEMPKALVVISDMEINPYFSYGSYRGQSLDFVKEMRRRFAQYGYSMPALVLWNVEARQDTFLTKDEAIFVSGQSASTFKQLCTNLAGKTAWDLMLEVLNDKMYDCVVV